MLLEFFNDLEDQENQESGQPDQVVKDNDKWAEFIAEYFSLWKMMYARLLLGSVSV